MATANNKDDVKEGAVIVDVGNTPDENGKLKGDVEFEEVKYYSMPRRIFSANNVLLSTIVIVNGPTPPGTGVIAPATSLTSSNSTSPFNLQ
jgi:hypothetical protein